MQLVSRVAENQTQTQGTTKSQSLIENHKGDLPVPILWRCVHLYSRPFCLLG